MTERRTIGSALTLVLVTHNELKRRLRDFSFLATALVAPFVFSVVLGLAFGGHHHRQLVRIGVVDQSRATFAQEAVEQGIRQAGLPKAVAVVKFSNYNQASAALRHGAVDAFIVVPPGFGASLENVRDVGQLQALASEGLREMLGVSGFAVTAPGPASSTDQIAVVASKSAALGKPVAEALASSIQARLYMGALSALTVYRLRHAPPDQLALIAREAAGANLPISVDNDALASGSNVLGYYAPSMAVVFLFILGGLATRGIALERKNGTLARLGASPIRALPVVAGKMLATAFAGFLSVVCLWLETTLIFGARWGAPGGVLVMAAASVLGMSGLSVFMTSFARDDREAMIAAVLVGFILGIVSGNFFPPGSLPVALQYGSLVVPNGWALLGFGRLSQEGLGWQSTLVPAAVLCLIGAVFLAASMARINSALRR